MPNLSEDILSRLLNHIEGMYVENLILRDELRHRDQATLNRVIEDAKASPKMKKKIAALFRPLRSSLSEEVRLEEAIREFAKATPAKWEN